MAERNEGVGNPHVLVVTEIMPPDGSSFDDGKLEYEVEHPPSCGRRSEVWGGVEMETYDCDVQSQIDNCGLEFTLRYSGTPITEPGTYRIQGWWNRSPSGPWGPAEYDAGVAVLEKL